jgi:hypothetical protein
MTRRIKRPAPPGASPDAPDCLYVATRFVWNAAL